GRPGSAGEARGRPGRADGGGAVPGGSARQSDRADARSHGLVHPGGSAHATVGAGDMGHHDGAGVLLAGRSATDAPMTAETAPSVGSGLLRMPDEARSPLPPGAWHAHRPAELEVQLDGGNLGPVTVRVAEHHGTVAARFLVEDGTASHLLQRNLPELEQRLEEAGLTAGQLEVSLAGQGHGHRPTPEGRRMRPGVGGVAALAERRAHPGVGAGPLRAPPRVFLSSGGAERLPGDSGHGLDLLM
ncbi:MAG: flagellar hook-length control protein FliK, partial [Bacillota bacterium]